MTREKAKKLRELIVKGSAGLSDEEALDAVELFPGWEYPKAYAQGDRFRWEGKLYKALQAHTSQADWRPDAAYSLYAEIAKPGEGTRENPITYNGNMTLEEGLYYSQAGVVYVCTRSTGIPVYTDLAALVGLYVEVA